MIKTYLPFILLFFAIVICIGVLFVMDQNRYLYFLRSFRLSNATIMSPLGNTNGKNSSSITPQTMTQSFTDSVMHIRFSYPETLEIEKKSNTLLWIHAKTAKDEKDSILLYVDKVAKTTATADVTVPFKIEGDISQSILIKKEGYTARVITFSSGATKTQVFFLRSDTQVIICRPPLTTIIDPNVVYNIVDSITFYK